MSIYRKDMRGIIVDSFIEEFNLHGPKLTLDDVCARIHISKKTIYRNFNSKDDIYVYILEDAVNQIRARQEEIYKDECLSIAEKLRAILTIETSWESKIDLSRLHELSEESPKILARILSAYEDSWEYLGKLLVEGLEAGVVKKDVHPKLVIAFLRADMEALYDKGLLSESGLTYTQAISRLADFALEGILVG